jgi:hypothetical protein
MPIGRESVLECASVLALWDWQSRLVTKKRQDTGALQNALAPNWHPMKPRPIVVHAAVFPSKPVYNASVRWRLELRWESERQLATKPNALQRRGAGELSGRSPRITVTF